MSEEESIEKLLACQQDLQNEKECLKQIITKLNEQIHALQIEQLQILNAINKSNTTTSNETEPLEQLKAIEDELQELDLSLPIYDSSEEDDDDDDEME